MPRLIVIDVMPLLYRGHFVFLSNPRMTSRGENVSALQVFVTSLTQVLKDPAMTHVALAFDSRTETFRKAIYPAYKATRSKAHEDIVAAIPMVEELAEALRIPALRVDGFEADDLLGTLARMGREAAMEVYLMTPDKDAAQLVGGCVKLYHPAKAGALPTVLDEEGVKTHWGITSPAQMIDLLALAGDSSDNIPGIRGVGEKTALKLLAQFGSLDDILAHAAEIPGKLGEKVAAGVAEARLCHELAKIRQDVPLDVTLASLARNTPDEEAAKAFFQKYEMLTLGTRLLGTEIKAEDKPKPKKTALETIDEEADENHAYKHLADVEHEYVCVTTPQEIEALVKHLASCQRWAFDTETTDVDPWSAELVGMSFATAPARAWYVPVPATEVERKALLEHFKPLFADASIEKIGQNIKFDMTVLWQHGVEVKGPLQDTLLEHYVLDAGDRHGMDYMACQRLNYEPIPISAVIGKGAEAITMAEAPLDKITEYAAEDADVTLRLHDALWPEVEKAGCVDALLRSEIPLVQVLIDMEAEGVRVDPRVLDVCRAELDREVADLERRIQEVAKTSGFMANEEGDLFSAAGAPVFNVNSPRQVGELLFGHLKLVANPKRTPTGQFATDEDTLQRLAGHHEVVDLILDHRVCAKLKNTYVDKLPECINPHTGRIHTQFSQALTETGRLSSYAPNLQNIPIRTPRGRRLREAFVARDDDHLLLCADYSQIELRVMAAMSQDPAMLAAFQNNADIHTETAARVYNVDPLFVTPDMRSAAKMVNFGIIYGISAFGLGQRLGVPQREAAQLIDTYFAQYPRIKTYMDESIALAREKGYAVTLLGRRRYLRDLQSRNAPARSAAERNAINTPIQGSAADLIKLAMVRIHRELLEKDFETRMILQVHDELVFDVPRNEVERATPLIRHAMTSVLTLSVPLVVDIGIAPNWLQAH